MSKTNKILFSIIVPVYHGGNYLRDLLKSLHELDFPSDKIELNVAGSVDDKKSRKIVETEIAAAKFDIHYIGCVNSKKAVQLNAACAEAKGRFLFFVDDDCVLVPDCLKKSEEVIRRETDIGVIGGRDELEVPDSAFELALDCILNSFLGTGGLRKKTGLSVGQYYPRLWNMMIPRDVLSTMRLDKKEGRLQIFNESLSVYEDVELVRRIEISGKRIVFAPEIAVKHRRNTNFFSYVARNYRSAYTCKVLRIHSFPQIMLGLFVLWGIAGSLLSIFFSTIRIFLLGSLVIYSVSLSIVALKGAIKTGSFRATLYIPLLLFSLHFSRGLTYLICWPSRKCEI